MAIQSFSPEVCEKIKYYVYRLIDPRNGQTFYIGKGKGNRVFAHVNCALNEYQGENYEDQNDDICAKYKQIYEIKNAGLEVIHVIQRYGLDNETALEVEAALIDCFPALTNNQNGHFSERGVINAQTLERDYSLETYKERDDLKYMIIKTTYERVYNHCSGDIYEAARYSWKINKQRADKIDYVLAVINGVVKGVYKVHNWQLADNGERYEFFGEDAEPEIKNYFINKRIPSKYTKKGAANPVIYHD